MLLLKYQDGILAETSYRQIMIIESNSFILFIKQTNVSDNELQQKGHM